MSLQARFLKWKLKGSGFSLNLSVSVVRRDFAPSSSRSVEVDEFFESRRPVKIF